jgi:hypothetical protein
MRLVPNSSRFFIIIAIPLLAVASYLPTLTQPFIEDDYPNILLARHYGTPSGWLQMAHDPVNRVRATTFILTNCIERIFGLRPAAFYSVSILLHILNCCLVFALGRSPVVGFQVSKWSAAFFAIYEGHQEAVMWYSASNELLLFFFGTLSLLCWLIFIEQEKPRRRWYLASIGFFVLALLSKESAIIFVPLLFLALLQSKTGRQRVWFLAPFVVLAIVYGMLIIKTRSYSFRFHDQSFELTAPFWETWTESFFALLIPWGWLAIVALVIWQRSRQVLTSAGIWISLSLMPYMFVGYMHRIPSRQIYLASAGLALIAGAAVVGLRERTVRSSRAWIAAAILTIVLFHNFSYLWFRKHEQFLQRAQPTEQLISFVRDASGPVYVRCFPRPRIIGDAAVEATLGVPAGTLIWEEDEARRRAASSFCYEPK